MIKDYKYKDLLKKIFKISQAKCLICYLFLITLTACSDQENIFLIKTKNKASNALPEVTQSSGVVIISTFPSGAEIKINGYLKGSTPDNPGGLSIRLGEGHYTIEATNKISEFYELYGVRGPIFVADNTEQIVTIAMSRRLTNLGIQYEYERNYNLELKRRKDAALYNYIVSNDGHEVFDNKTRLIWMRCSLGQIWQGYHCSGVPATYTWEQAKDAAIEFNSTESSNWRLPTIDELKSLVHCNSSLQQSHDQINDRMCDSNNHSSVIVDSAFPNTPLTPPKASFWSSTPDSRFSGFAWGVYFANGQASGYSTGHALSVRLVRTE